MKTRKIVRFILKTELIEHFISGLTQGLCALMVMNALVFGQTLEAQPLKNRFYSFSLPLEFLKGPVGKNTKKADEFYDELWKTPQIIKNLYEVGTMSETAFLVEFNTNVSDSMGVEFIENVCMKHFGVNPKVSRETFKRKVRLASGVILKQIDGKEVLEVKFDIDLPLVKQGLLTEFSEDLMDAIEADEEAKIYREPSEDLPHSFTVRMPQNKFAEIKELVIDHLRKSGYEVILDQ